MSSYIYAFDLSMSDTGIAIFDLEGHIEKVCSIATKDSDSHGKRLKTIYDFILELTKEYPVEKVIIERAFSRFNTATAVIFRVHGLINFMFWDKEQIYYTPKAVKAEIVSGKSTKKQIQESIIIHYPEINFENEDESDAASIGFTYFIKNGTIAWR